MPAFERIERRKKLQGFSAHRGAGVRPAHHCHGEDHPDSVKRFSLFVCATLKRKGRVSLEELILHNETRSDIVATFIALLQLIRKQEVTIAVDDPENPYLEINYERDKRTAVTGVRRAVSSLGRPWRPYSLPPAIPSPLKSWLKPSKKPKRKCAVLPRSMPKAVQSKLPGHPVSDSRSFRGQLCSEEEYKEYIRTAMGIKSSGKLSASCLEALAIIAYNQPVTKAYVEQIRGVDCSWAIGTLCDKQLIEMKKLAARDAPRKTDSLRNHRRISQSVRSSFPCGIAHRQLRSSLGRKGKTNRRRGKRPEL